MRTLGYPRRTILSLVLTESTLICLIGGLLGCLAAFAAFLFFDVTVQARTYNFGVSLNGWTVLVSLGIAVLVGVAGGFLPALRASRMNIVKLLRSVD
jgi:ABC-type antimicrobial peptide transport system permease subunit